MRPLEAPGAIFPSDSPPWTLSAKNPLRAILKRNYPLQEDTGMSEDKARRWRHLTPAQREHIMSAVAAIQSGLDDLADEPLAEALRPEYIDFLHRQDRLILLREQKRRGAHP